MTGLRTYYDDKEPYVLGIGFIVLLLLLWESVPLFFTLPRGIALFFTTPTKIGAAFYRLLMNGELEKHFYVSAIAFLGLGLSISWGCRWACSWADQTLEAL
jgi:ABC-type nitrate/sulfonate/bicarbonate transport system permease component